MKRVTLALALTMVAMPVVAGTVSGKADCGGACETTLVYLEGAPGRTAEGGSTAVFDQKEKVFIPHVLPVQQGTTVQITNGDPFLHNVHIYRGKETILNIALPFQGQVMPHKFDDAGIYAVSCDAHPEMSAYIAVLESPFFAVVGEDGSYEIGEVPAGSYTLVVQNLKSGEAARSPVVVN